jgi:hypothetical protein
VNKNVRFALYGAAAGLIVMRLAVRGYPVALDYGNFLQKVSDAITTEAVF